MCFLAYELNKFVFIISCNISFKMNKPLPKTPSPKFSPKTPPPKAEKPRRPSSNSSLDSLKSPFISESKIVESKVKKNNVAFNFNDTAPTVPLLIEDKIPKMDAGIYVGFANLPNQVHRKSVKRGFEFTLMVVGESGLGKSTLVDSLFLTSLYAEREIPEATKRITKTISVTTSTVEIEEKGVKLKLTVVDTPGFADAVNNSDSWQPVVTYINEQYEAYLRDESGLNRRNITDNRVHCCLYFINPVGHGLKPIDIAMMKALHDKVNIVPVIAKADTLTVAEVKRLKERVLKEIKEEGIQIYQFPEADDEEDDEEFIEVNKQLKASVPFAVVGSNTVYEVNGKKVRGRIYPWGVVDIENPVHCDFTMLRNMLIRTHMQDLKDVTQDVHYENFRAKTLANGGGEPGKTLDMSRSSSGVDERDALLQEKEAELRRMQDMIAKMQKSMSLQKAS